MKKVIITVAALAAITFSANAQVFVGGTAGLDYNGGNVTANSIKTDKESKVGFTIAPNVGWYFADNFLAGARLGIGFDKNTTPGALADTSSRMPVIVSPSGAASVCGARSMPVSDAPPARLRSATSLLTTILCLRGVSMCCLC